jgi:hypothetical protein
MTGKELGQQPAFPELTSSDIGYVHTHDRGLTKRQYCAQGAMQAILGSSDLMSSAARMSMEERISVRFIVATLSANYADALLEELAKETE